MLDVHPPHHAANTWRDFFIHIATIAVGLLIAVGLEQTVEYVHHRHQVRDAREALSREREANQIRFAIESKELERELPIFRKNLAIFAYVRDHPHDPAEKWPGAFDGNILKIHYVDSAWRTAQQSNVLQYMPAAEVNQYAEIYGHLETINQLEGEKFDAAVNFRATFAAQSDPRLFSPEQLDRAIERATSVLVACVKQGNQQFNLNSFDARFSPSPQIGNSDTLNWHPSLAGYQSMVELINQLHDQLRAIGADQSNAAPLNALPAK
jgi:hypothetical protein